MKTLFTAVVLFFFTFPAFGLTLEVDESRVDEGAGTIPRRFP